MKFIQGWMPWFSSFNWQRDSRMSEIKSVANNTHAKPQSRNAAKNRSIAFTTEHQESTEKKPKNIRILHHQCILTENFQWNILYSLFLLALVKTGSPKFYTIQKKCLVNIFSVFLRDLRGYLAGYIKSILDKNKVK